MRPLSLYLHVPFCAAKCAYCDFASWPGKETDWSRYFDALARETDRWRNSTELGRLYDNFYVRTLFIGGGTPTLVPPEYIRDAVERCRTLAPFDDDAEITIEGNPGTLTPGKLEVYRRTGVNRLSLGAQSFDDKLLRSLGRIHTAAQIDEAVAMAREGGFGNINLDLMYALPGQSEAQWAETLDRAIALGVEHLSAYSLIVEPGTPMAARVAEGSAVIPDDERVNAMQRAAIKCLSRAGYARYEISNYAKPGFECRHNLTYWLRGDYLGLGCAAHSMIDDVRFANPETLEEYLSGRQPDIAPRMDREEIMEETILLATRTTHGLDLADWRERFGENFTAKRACAIERLIRGGLVETRDGCLRLTTAGMEVQNAVVLELL